MIERACELRVPLSDIAWMSRSENPLPKLSDGDWELLEVVARVLRSFEEASRPLCGDTYPTLNRAVPTYNFLLDDLEGFLGMRDNEDDGREKSAIINQCDLDNQHVLRKAMQKAHEKICKYYAKTWAGMYAVAVILDPRFNMAYYKANKWEPDHIAHAKNALLRVVEEYGATIASQPNRADTVAFPPDEEDDRAFRSLKKIRVEMGSEVERYLMIPPLISTSHVLEWWKHHSEEYPCLARIARDYLAIPATSAPAERAFSGGANLVSKKRGSLDEDTIQACLCLKSWLGHSFALGG
jgi:hypothetical protein